MKTIIIDPGHGGHDPGAIGRGGLREANVALDVALRLELALKDSGHRVLLTRRDNTFVELNERARMANKEKADLFLSIHCNAGGGHGFEVFTSPGQTVSDSAAINLFNAYAREFPQLRKRMDLSDGDEDKEAKFTVLTHTQGPAVLFELEFIDTATGEKFLRDTTNRGRMARALAFGIMDHFSGMVGNSSPSQQSRRQKACDHIRRGLHLLES